MNDSHANEKLIHVDIGMSCRQQGPSGTPQYWLLYRLEIVIIDRVRDIRVVESLHIIQQLDDSENDR
jgi:hypothetical protein